ncbi:hypothetical protein QT231_18350 [Halomonas sp. SpR1]|uniref:hypothetical protein n=1 Tax=Halomonas sp. SpR1 TaxID=3050462 RepID=UPI0027E58698|nr:hypothetical protein [Halomonas sp. SpR1]MDQ7734675.1 hypothetical protein [Halomonas sp. SpR1]
MAIDPDWVRENPEEAARQLDVLGDMHVDHVRYLWESRGFGGCVEFAEAFDSLEKKYAALKKAKLEALPTDLKKRYVIIKMTGDIERDTARKIGEELRKYTAGNATFVNMPVDIETIDMSKRDALIKAKALLDMSERLEAYSQPIAANQCWNEADRIRRQAEGGA